MVHPPVLEPEAAHPVGCEPLLAPTWHEVVSRHLRQGRKGDVPLDREVHQNALLTAVLRDEANSRLHGCAGHTRRKLPPVHLDPSCVSAVDTKDRPHYFAATGAGKAGKGHDLAASHLERYVRERAEARQVFDFENDVARAGRPLGEQGSEVPPDHCLDHRSFIHLGHWLGDNEPAIAQDRDALA